MSPVIYIKTMPRTFQLVVEDSGGLVHLRKGPLPICAVIRISQHSCKAIGGAADGLASLASCDPMAWRPRLIGRILAAFESSQLCLHGWNILPAHDFHVLLRQGSFQFNQDLRCQLEKPCKKGGHRIKNIKASSGRINTTSLGLHSRLP